jgi:hypothetical protein
LADAILLKKGRLTISIQHIRMSEPVSWDGRFSGGGLPQEASQESVTLIGQEAPKWVWTVDDEELSGTDRRPFGEMATRFTQQEAR